jgi:hypothetical protein
MKSLLSLILFFVVCPVAGAAILSATATNGDSFPNDTSTGTVKTGDTVTVQQGGTVHVTDYLVPTLAHTDPANPIGTASLSMTDRRHAYAGFGAALGLAGEAANFPTYLIGLPYVMTMNGNRDNVSPPFRIDITTNGPGSAYLFLDTRLGDGASLDDPSLSLVANGAADWITADGWTPVITGLKPADFTGTIDILGADENFDGSINNYYAIYSRAVTGSSFSVHTFGEGRNIYGVAFAAIPEPSAAALGVLAGLGLLRRRR